MTLRIDGFVLHFRKPRKDGSRNVERARLRNWRFVQPARRPARAPKKRVGKRLTVRIDDQLTLGFVREAAG